MAKAVAAPRRDGADPQSGRHVPGEPGIWVLIFGDLSVFAALFTVYLQHRGRNPEIFAQSQATLSQTFGAVNTLLLLGSSLLVVLATKEVRRPEQRHLAPWLMLAALLLGACFVVIKAIEYHQKFSVGITPNTNEFFMYYFVLTGVHLLHVLVGLGVLGTLSRLVIDAEPSATKVAFIEGGACFWHMVDLLWIVIFPLLFLVR